MNGQKAKRIRQDEWKVRKDVVKELRQMFWSDLMLFIQTNLSKAPTLPEFATAIDLLIMEFYEAHKQMMEAKGTIQ
ncbi:MAG: hypothetical protein AMJ45_04370 [Syntrophobacter sp. DG_60]|nr:MAG: hypothetical protein AMJ45_04370 [Syntrophobacter sp. DG_60]